MWEDYYTGTANCTAAALCITLLQLRGFPLQTIYTAPFYSSTAALQSFYPPGKTDLDYKTTNEYHLCQYTVTTVKVL